MSYEINPDLKTPEELEIDFEINSRLSGNHFRGRSESVINSGKSIENESMVKNFENLSDEFDNQINKPSSFK